jgi:hypothetical protein
MLEYYENNEQSDDLNNENIIDSTIDVADTIEEIMESSSNLVVLSEQLNIAFPGELEQKYLFKLK